MASPSQIPACETTALGSSDRRANRARGFISLFALIHAGRGGCVNPFLGYSYAMRTHLDSDSILTATVGIASPVLGVITSFQEQIEWTLRVASLIVGLMVGAMSLIAMVKKMRGK